MFKLRASDFLKIYPGWYSENIPLVCTFRTSTLLFTSLAAMFLTWPRWCLYWTLCLRGQMVWKIFRIFTKNIKFEINQTWNLPKILHNQNFRPKNLHTKKIFLQKMCVNSPIHEDISYLYAHFAKKRVGFWKKLHSWKNFTRPPVVTNIKSDINK